MVKLEDVSQSRRQSWNQAGLQDKTHGSSKAMEITNSIYQCVSFKEQDINGKIREHILVENTEEEKVEKGEN